MKLNISSYSQFAMLSYLKLGLYTFISLELLNFLFKRCVYRPACEIETECSSKTCKTNGTCVDLTVRFEATFY